MPKMFVHSVRAIYEIQYSKQKLKKHLLVVMHQNKNFRSMFNYWLFLRNQCFAVMPTNKITTMKETMEDITEL